MIDLCKDSLWWLCQDHALQAMTVRQVALVGVICDEPGPHRIRTMAPRIGASKSAVSRAMDSLVDTGIIDRHRDPADKRDCFFTPTKLGKRVRRMMKGDNDG